MKHRSARSRYALALALALVLGACGSSRAQPRAVFLIVVDTLRADRLSCYGYDGHRTPHVDALAEAGTLFEGCRSAASWTVPSMGALMSSLFPTQLGLVGRESPPGKVWDWKENRPQLAFMLPLPTQTLAEAFREGGFRTAGFVNQPALSYTNGFVQGFDTWDFATSATEIRRIRPPEGLDPSIRGELLTALPFRQSARHAESIEERLVAAFDGWLAESRAGKSFAWLHLLTPHRPYAPDHPAGDGPPPSDAELYDLDVLAADRLVGEILASIERHVGLENAIVLFTADHGEELADHGREGHGHSLYDEVVRVPLIVAAPGVPRGAREARPVRSVDVYPTLLALAGLGALVPDEAEGRDLFGEQGPAESFSEGMLFGSTKRSFLADATKLVFDEQGEVTLYDVAADPAERHDLAGERPELLSELRARMEALHERLERYWIEHRGLYERSVRAELLDRLEARHGEALQAGRMAGPGAPRAP